MSSIKSAWHQYSFGSESQCIVANEENGGLAQLASVAKAAES